MLIVSGGKGGDEQLSEADAMVGYLVARGFPADRILLHGNAKTPGDLRAAMAYGAVRIVLDSAGEIARIAALARPRQRVLVRVTPGVDAHAHDALLDLVVPGKPDESELIRQITTKNMPPDMPMDDQDVVLLTSWITAGAEGL